MFRLFTLASTRSILIEMTDQWRTLRPGITKGASKKEKNAKEKKGKKKEGKKKEKKEKRGTRKRKYRKVINMMKGAPFKHKQGLQGRKVQGRYLNWREWGAILQLGLRAPKLMTHLAPWVWTSWICLQIANSDIDYNYTVMKSAQLLSMKVISKSPHCLQDFHDLEMLHYRTKPFFMIIFFFSLFSSFFSLRCRSTLRGHADSVNSILFLPYSNTLLTSSADKTISLWDARTVSILWRIMELFTKHLMPKEIIEKKFQGAFRPPNNIDLWSGFGYKLSHQWNMPGL